MDNKRECSAGKAYGFFDCNASNQEIEAELPKIRKLVETPSQLELSLIENPNKKQDLNIIARKASEGALFNQEYNLITSAIKEGEDLDKNFKRLVRLIQIIDIGKGSGVRYAMIASYPNRTNKDTADELVSVLNQIYQSTLYEEGESFNGAIAYEERGEYVIRD